MLVKLTCKSSVNSKAQLLAGPLVVALMSLQMTTSTKRQRSAKRFSSSLLILMMMSFAWEVPWKSSLTKVTMFMLLTKLVVTLPSLTTMLLVLTISLENSY